MANKLVNALTALAEALDQTVDDDLRAEIVDLVDNNELLEDEDSVPQWLVNFLGAIQNAEEIDWVHYPDSGYSFSDVFELLGELEDILPLSYEHREESIALLAESLGVEGVIWLESNQYRVTKL